MSSPISIGDVLMLSQLAWKVGCAFTAGRAGAPQQFLEVENELGALTTALDLLAETLDEDLSILASANATTKAGVSKVLVCCRQTLQDLNSFVARYQDLSRPGSAASNHEQGTERSWKKLLVKNWKTVWWTTEGGNIDALRDMLQMHASSISLTMQALQSKSLSRLEKTVAPMAVQVDEVHDLVVGRMNNKIDDMHLLMMSMARQQSPDVSGLNPPYTQLSIQGRRSTGLLVGAASTSPEGLTDFSNPFSSASTNRGEHDRSSYPLSPQRTPDLIEYEWPLPTTAPSVSTASPISSPHALSTRLSPRMLASNKSRQASLGWDLPRDQLDSTLMSLDEEEELQQGPWFGEGAAEYSERWRSMSGGGDSSSFNPSLRPAPLSPQMRSGRAASDSPEHYRAPQPPPIMPPLPEPGIPIRADVDGPKYSHLPQVVPEPTRLDRAVTTLSQHELFERALWRNAVTLCEVKGKLVEYTQWDGEEADYKMVEAARDCQIYLVHRQDPQSDGEARHSTSIWALSNDRQVRFQQKLTNGELVVPYTVWGVTNKVTIRVKSVLKFHDVTYGAQPSSVTESSWVNYIFENDDASQMFQAALMGKTLLTSFKTNKTLRVHEGITGSFAFQEQMCALENLRIWQDHDSNGVMAMLHFTPQFRDGYLAFHLNSARDPIRVRDEGDRFVKIKGLNIPLESKRANSVTDMSNKSLTKAKTEKMITAVRVEFTTEQEKRDFIERVRDAQGLYFPG